MHADGYVEWKKAEEARLKMEIEKLEDELRRATELTVKAQLTERIKCLRTRHAKNLKLMHGRLW